MKDPGMLARSLLQKHFPKFGSIRKKCIYYQTADGQYNVETREVSPVIVSTYPEFWIIFDEFTANETKFPESFTKETTILSTDKKAIFPAFDLPFIPSVGDIIEESLLVSWVVKGVSSDPAIAGYALHVRKIKV